MKTAVGICLAAALCCGVANAQGTKRSDSTMVPGADNPRVQGQHGTMDSSSEARRDDRRSMRSARGTMHSGSASSRFQEDLAACRDMDRDAANCRKEMQAARAEGLYRE